MDKTLTQRIKLADDKCGGLPSWAYTNPEFFEIEKQQLFCQTRLAGPWQDINAKLRNAGTAALGPLRNWIPVMIYVTKA